ncbi:MAG TPA: ATP-binding protein [Mariniphaga sp.]|nr:ATP-binding protein [Mariniphaga sp.]
MESNLSAVNQKQTHKIVPYTNQILESIFSNVQEGILLIDYEGNLIDINPEGMRIHGVESHAKENIINAPLNFFSILSVNKQEIVKSSDPVERLLTNGSFNDERYFIKMRKDSPVQLISYTGIPQYDQEGNFATGLLLARLVEHNLQDNKYQNFLIGEYFNPNIFQQQLKNNKELLQTIIDTIPVMVTIYDKQMDSFIFNQAFNNITGWTTADIEDRNVMELVYPDPEYRKKILEYMMNLEPGFQDIIMRTRDGRDIETSWANVGIPDGRQVGVGIDISERKKLEMELVKARERAEKENKVQHAFIQNISHEVRTPMNSILGFTELLQKELTDKKETEFLNAIYFNGKQLLKLIDDIIDFSRLDNNQVTVQKEVLNLNLLMKQIGNQAESIKRTFKKRHLKLNMKQPDNTIQAILDTDNLRLQQVLLNLISNAIKYTEEGAVEIGYEIREDKHDILFYVSDTGIGIDEVNSNRVFRRFNRLHDTRRQEFRGTGLGLAICKHLVNLLGGEIWFKSKPGQGTVFYFSHPYKELEGLYPEPPVKETKQVEKSAEFAMPDLSNKVILIVEDDSFSYMMMYHMLEESKAIILHADTGRKAIEIFEKYNVDLVFLDIRLPELDGYQVLKYMRQLNKNIPVVAQTANALPEDKIKIRNAGFNSYITKPISRNNLLTILYKFFQ